MSGSKVVLADGAQVVIRPVEAADVPLLADGFARLSEQSRQLRFLTPKPQLSAAELRYFTDVDHSDHEALGALDPATERGVGIARYVRRVDDRQAAEVAVAVADDWQHRGLGTHLLERLVERARQEGIRRFTALAAGENPAVFALLNGIGGSVRAAPAGAGTIEYSVELPDAGLSDDVRALLHAAGRRQLQPPHPIRSLLATLIPDRIPPDERPT